MTKALLSGAFAAILFGIFALVWCTIITAAENAYHDPPVHYGQPTAPSAYKDRYHHVSYTQPKGYTKTWQNRNYQDGTTR